MRFVTNLDRLNKIKTLEWRNSPWTGFDFDGTLVTYEHWVSPKHIGSNIDSVLSKMQSILDSGNRVKIFTARIYPISSVTLEGEIEHLLSNIEQNIDQAIEAANTVMEWCCRQFGHPIEITCVKDFACIAYYDDIAIQVKKNFGERADGKPL